MVGKLDILGATHFDGIPKELMEVMDPHWGTFPPQVKKNTLFPKRRKK